MDQRRPANTNSNFQSRPKSTFGALPDHWGSKSIHSAPQSAIEDDDPELRPHLPPRRAETGLGLIGSVRTQTRERSTTPGAPKIRSMTPPRAGADAHSHPEISLSLLKRNTIGPGNSHAWSPTESAVKGVTRNVTSTTQNSMGSVMSSLSGSTRVNDSDEDDYAPGVNADPRVAHTEYPDSSQTNRRPPFFKRGPLQIETKYDSRLIAVCGQYVCTTGHVTRAWDILTGELVMSISHGETVKGTALCFKPAIKALEEGNIIWIGTSSGEIHEIDIPSQNELVTKSNAHPRSQIIKIHRHANEMWSVDDDGRLHVWQADPDTGLPDLRNSPLSCRINRAKDLVSIVVGKQVWVATGKELRIYEPRANPVDVFSKPLSASSGKPNEEKASEFTSGTVLGDKVYFGHMNGMISCFDRRTYQCLDVRAVSLYKINALQGVGSYLWAGFKTGMIYVYDVSSSPWKVKKDWNAHENPVSHILVDTNSIWKLDRLQIVSFSTDNCIRVWDGLLEDDWLGVYSQLKTFTRTANLPQKQRCRSVMPSFVISGKFVH
jgi:WD40 repeat protein